MKKKTFNICFSTDNNYMEQLGVSIVSILKNSLEDETFNFYILNSGIEKENKAKIEQLKKIRDFNIEFISINSEEFKNCKLLNKTEKNMENYHVTLPTYFRYKIGNLFKDISTLLYLDCDVIVKKSLGKLFDIDLKDNYCAMILDAESQREVKRLGLKKYFNAGVMLINLDLWRKDNLEKKLFDYTIKNAKKILWQDQDVINIVCKNKIIELGNEWNFQFFLYGKENYDELVLQLKNAYILHLAGRFKPWTESFEHPVFYEYYYYLSLTPWANKIQEYKYRCFGKFLEGNTGGDGKYVVSEEELFQNKLKPVYSMIDEAYDFTKKEIAVQKDDFNNKINNVYSEITNNYEFTKSEINKKTDEVRSELQNNIIRETDSKIHDVYSEITNNYEFTKSEINKKADEIKDNITRETDGKIHDVYSEISNNYGFTKSEINKKADEVRGEISEIKENIKIETDGKIHDVYKEISNNYDFTKSEINKKADEVKDSLTKESDKKIDSVNETIKALSHRANELIGNQKQQTENKIDQIYSQMENDYELLKKQIQGTQENLNHEIQENVSRIEEMSLTNFEEAKAGFIKLIQQLSNNNDKFFEVLNDYHETQERRLIQRLNDVKFEILDNISKYEELRNIVREEISVAKEAELRNIREYTDNEINNSRQVISQVIEQMKKDEAVKDRNRRLDFEKQLLDMEMKYKSLKNVLTPVISVMKRFKKSNNNSNSPVERKK